MGLGSSCGLADANEALGGNFVLLKNSLFNSVRTRYFPQVRAPSAPRRVQLPQCRLPPFPDSVALSSIECAAKQLANQRHQTASAAASLLFVRVAISAFILHARCLLKTFCPRSLLTPRVRVRSCDGKPSLGGCCGKPCKLLTRK